MRFFGGRSAAEILLLVKVAFGSAGGGVLAMAVLVLIHFPSPQPLTLLGLLALVLTVLCVVAVAAVQSPDGDGVGHAHPRYPCAGPPPMLPPYVNGTGTLPPSPAGPQWYDQAAQHSAALRTLPAPDDARAAGAPQKLPRVEPDVDRRPAVVDEHRVPGATGRRRRIVQCPRCAAFEIDVWDEREGFAFGCQACQNQWRWIPGTPWPPTVVRPALARHRPPARPA